mmetsp:Transcript_26993/g.86742  ORF Transcript_26993/g.86742 Transcript_26993/m.86742 type:complete len:114 (-) Transcript_26993:104-445(-)
MGGANIVEVSSDEDWAKLKEQAKTENKSYIVDFWASWCGPCRMIAPFFVELSETFTSIIFVKVDVDAAGGVAEACGVSAMPTFQVYNAASEKVDEVVGANKDSLKKAIEKAAA